MMVWLRNTSKRKKYYSETSLEPPSEILLKSLKFVKGKTALDIGCGAGVDAKELARRNFKVEAVDINEDVNTYFDKKDLNNIKLTIKAIENFKFGNYDFVFAKSSLVFLCPKKFHLVIKQIKKSLNKNGVFAARLWGNKDSENKSGKNFEYTFLPPNEIYNIFDGYTILLFEQHEKDRIGADGKMKHWHFIDLIIRKP